MTPTRRFATLVVGVAALAVVAAALPHSALPELVADLGPVAPAVAVLVGVGLLMALMPRTPISLACGLLFGAVAGTVCALVVALIAAALTFAAGRWLGRDWVARRAGQRWATVERWIAREGVLAVATVRALPLGPYGLIGYAYGASPVKVRHYALGTLISSPPAGVTYAVLGAAVAQPGDVHAATLAPLAFGLALCFALVIRMRLRYSSSGVK